MGNSYSNYIKQVERALDLPQRQRNELLRGLQTELKERFTEAPSDETLRSDLGTPEEVACALLDAVGTEAHTHFISVRLRKLALVVATLVLLLVIAVGAVFYSYSTELKRVEVTIIEDAVPTLHSMDAEGE